MAQDPIDEFIALPRDQQLLTLQKLSPEKQDKLLGEIKTRKSKTPAPAKPEGSPAGRFLSSAGSVIGGAVSGLYQGVVEGPQNPEEAKWQNRGLLTSYRMFLAPAQEQMAAAEKEYQAAKQAKTPYQTAIHGTKEVGHVLAAALPGVGPWVAQAGSQIKQQIGKGDIAGAAGTAAGNIALYEAPRAVKGGSRLLAKPVRSMIETTTGTGLRGLREMAQEVIQKNAAAATEAARKNAEAAKEHLQKTQTAVHETAGRERTYERRVKTTDEKMREDHAKARAEVAKKNHDALAKHADAVAKVQEENSKILREEQKRIETQKDLNIASQDLDQKIEKVRAKAKAEDDAAWATWREKVGTAEAPSNEIVDQINASKSTMDPEDVAEFRKVLKETKPGTGEAGEVQETKDSIAKNQGAKSYAGASPQIKAVIDDIVKRIGLDPDEVPDVKAVNAERLHVWKTQLEYAVRNATRGNVRYAIGQVLDKVRGTETKLSEAAGAGEELKTARSLHGPYKDTFVNSPNEPATVASKALAETSPEFAKEKARTKRINMLGQYDPSIVKDAERISGLRSELDKLPDRGPAQERMKPQPAPPELLPEPKPPIPARQTVAQPVRVEHPNRPAENVPVQEVLTPEEITARRKSKLHESAEALRKISARRAIYSSLSAIPMMILSAGLGHPGYAIAELIAAPTAVLGGGNMIADFLERPGVVDALTKIKPRDVAALAKLPPEEKAVFAQNIGRIVQEAQKKGIRVSPALTTFAIGSAVAPSTTKSIRQLREEAQQLKQQTVSAIQESGEANQISTEPAVTTSGTDNPTDEETTEEETTEEEP